MNCGKRENNPLFFYFTAVMRSTTVIYLKWKLTGRIEIFSNLGKLYDRYSITDLDVSRHTLNRKDLYSGWESDMIEIKKFIVY
jgi:hypothetical protein